jgi:hypothetical protein
MPAVGLYSGSVRRALLLTLLVGCSKANPPTPQSRVGPAAALTASGDSTIQPGNTDDVPHLEFTITSVYEKQKSLDHPPWHTTGGDLTFFEGDAAGARFTFGFLNQEKDASPFRFGEAFVSVPTADDGARLIQAFARGFHVGLPSIGRAGPVHGLRFSAALLGSEMARSSAGGFRGRGTWSACKWFLNRGEAEVYFNFSIRERRGYWSEKDEEYDKDVVIALARALRDGVAELAKQ